MKNHHTLLALLIMLLAPAYFQAQQQPCKDYACVIARAKKALAAKNYRVAFEQLESAEGYPDKQEKEITNMRQQLFYAVEREKNEAKRQKAKVEIERDKTLIQKNKADSIALANRIQFLDAYANDLYHKSTIALERGDRATAIQLASFANKYVMPGRFSNEKALVEALYYNDIPYRNQLPWYKTMSNGNSPVISVLFSPEGDLLASGSENGGIRIWNVESGTLFHYLQGHNDAVGGLAFTPDGKRLISGSADGTIKIWDTHNGKLINTLSGHQDGVRSVKVTSDGKKLVSSSFDETIKIWDLDSGEVTKKLENPSSVWCIELSRDDKRIFSSSQDGKIFIWDFLNGTLQDSLEGHNREVRCMALSPTNQLITCSLDGTIKIWDLALKNSVSTISESKELIESIAYAPSGGSFISCNQDGKVKIWNSNQGEPSFTFLGHAGSVTSVAFSPDGRHIASGAWDKTIKIWDLYIQEAATFLENGNCIAYAPDGEHIAIGKEQYILIWNLKLSRPTLTLTGHQSQVSAIEFSLDGKLLASVADSAALIIWDVAKGTQVQSLHNQNGIADAVHFFPDRQRIAFIEDKGIVKIWQLINNQVDVAFRSKDRIESIAISPDGNNLAIACWDNTVTILNSKSYQEILRFKDHVGPVRAVEISPHGKMIASGSSDHSVLLRDAQNGKLIKFYVLNEEVMSLAFSKDGNRLAMGTIKGNIKIWNLQNFKESYDLMRESETIASQLCFSPDGTRMITENTGIQLWDFTLEGWSSTENGQDSPQFTINSEALFSYNLESLLDLHPDNESKLIATRETWQIKAFADLAAQQAAGSNILSRVEAPYSRANRLYAAALALQDEPLIRMDYAKMLRKWAAVYRDNGEEPKAKDLEAKADQLWKP